jgi:hypothetical protein
MTTTETENPAGAPAALASPQDGLQALRQLTGHLAASPRAQAVHRFVGAEKSYVVRHDPANCKACHWIKTIEQALIAAQGDAA